MSTLFPENPPIRFGLRVVWLEPERPLPVHLELERLVVGRAEEVGTGSGAGVAGQARHPAPPTGSHTTVPSAFTVLIAEPARTGSDHALLEGARVEPVEEVGVQVRDLDGRVDGQAVERPRSRSPSGPDRRRCSCPTTPAPAGSVEFVSPCTPGEIPVVFPCVPSVPMPLSLKPCCPTPEVEMPFVPIPFVATPRTAAAVPVDRHLQLRVPARVAGEARLCIDRVHLPEVEHAAHAGAGEGGRGGEDECCHGCTEQRAAEPG